MPTTRNLRFEKTNHGYIPHSFPSEELFFSTIVKVGSLQREETHLSGISCRRQNFYGTSCEGNLLILKKGDSKTIFWACNTCDDSGEIQSSFFEKHALIPPIFFKTEPAEEMELSVVFTQGEYSLLLGVEPSYLDPISEYLLLSAKKNGPQLEIVANESDMETFYACLRFLSKQSEYSMEQETFLSLSKKVKKALDWACFS